MVPFKVFVFVLVGLSFGPCYPVRGLFAGNFSNFYISFLAHPLFCPEGIFTHVAVWGLTLTGTPCAADFLTLLARVVRSWSFYVGLSGN